MASDQTRIYQRDQCVVFLKTKEVFGGLSNMAGGYGLRVNGIHIPSSEALYQACRFLTDQKFSASLLGNRAQ